MKVKKNVSRFLSFLLALVLMFTTFTSDLMVVTAEGRDDVSGDNIVAESVVDETDAIVADEENDMPLALETEATSDETDEDADALATEGDEIKEDALGKYAGEPDTEVASELKGILSEESTLKNESSTGLLGAGYNNNVVTIHFDINSGNYYYLSNGEPKYPYLTPVADITKNRKDSNKNVHLPYSTPIYKEGYVFDGWGINADGKGDKWNENSLVDIGKIAKKDVTDVTLYAIWKEAGKKDYYEITYAKYDKSIKGGAFGEIDKQKVQKGITTSLSTESFTAGYGNVQVGWEGPRAGEYYDFGQTYTGDKNVKMDAHWVNAGTYYIDYYKDENDTVGYYEYQDAVENKYSSDITKMSIAYSASDFGWSKEGKSFVGWKTKDGVQCEPGKEINFVDLYKSATKDSWGANVIKLYGQWEDAAPETYTITYDLDGIEVPEGFNTTVTPVKGEKVILASADALSKTGYTFNGWTLNNTIYVAGAEVDAFDTDVTLTAIWTPISYYLHYVANGGFGEEVDAGLIEYDAETNLLSAPSDFENPGYRLAGWSDKYNNKYNLGQKDVVLNLTTKNGDTENLYAEWELETYELKFFDENGNLTDSKEYTYTSETFTFTPTKAVKESCRFLGWQETTEGIESDALINSVTVNKNSYGNRTFKAVFATKELSVTFEDIDTFWLDENVYLANPVVIDADTKEEVNYSSLIFRNENKEIVNVNNGFGIGKQVLTATVSADGYPDKEELVTVDVHYYVPTEVPAGELTVANKATIDGKDWYGNFSGNELTLSFEGYKVSKLGNEKGYFDSVNISADEGPHSYDVTLMKLDAEGQDLGIVGTSEYVGPYHAEKEYAVDKTAPTVDIIFNRSTAKKVLNTLSFGLFFKDSVKVTVTASDNNNGSGLASVKYAKSDALVTDYDSLNWVDYTEAFDVNAEFKGLVYAKVTDKVGNETIVYTDGVVVYKSVNGISTEAYYTKTSGSDVSISGEAFGNTVKSVVVSKGWKNYVVGYTTPQYDSKDNNKFVLSLNHEDLEKLNVGDYNVAITFNCLDVDGKGNNQTVNVKLHVVRATLDLNLSIDKNEWVFDKYDATENKVTVSAVDNANKEFSVASNYKFSYKKNGAENYTALKNLADLNKLVPGEYTLKATYEEDSNFEKAEAINEFTVKTPEVYFYLRSNNTWTEIDHVEAGKLSAELFDKAFKDGAVGTIENNARGYNASTLADKYFANISDTIADLKANGYGISFHKIGLFDKSNNDVNHANSSKHFHVDFDLSKITDNNVSVTMDNWTYGDQGKTPVAKQSTTEPNSDTPKRGREQEVSFYYTGTLRGEPGAEYASVNAPTQAGTYKVIATFEANDYYNKTTAEKEFTIAPKIVKVDWMLDGKKNTSSVVYDGKAHSVKGEVTNEAYWGENYFVNPIWFENNKTAAGSYTSKAWEVVDRNGIRTYNYTFADTEKFDWTITQKELTISWNGNKAPTYNGTAHRFEATLNDIVNGDDVKPVYNTEAHFGGYPYMTEAVNAGNYTASVCGLTGKDADNYKIKPYTNTWCNWEIKKAPLTIEWPKNNSLVYDGTLQTYKAILSGIWGSDVVNPVYQNENVWRGYLRCLTESVNCARYIAEVVGVDNPNYTIDSAKNKSHEWEVTQRPLTINWSGKDEWNHSDWNFNFKYSEFPYTISCEFGNVANADRGKITPILAGNLEETNVGNYTAKVTGINGELAYNYKLPRNTVRNWSISYINAWDAVAVPFANRYGWNNTWVSLSEFGYKIRKTSEDGKQTWAPALVLTGETGEGVVEYRLQDTTGYITDVKTFNYKIDYTKPTADVTINDDSILTQVFRWFKKDSAVVKITAEDNLSGVKSIEWKFVGDEEYSDYNDLTGIVVDANKVADIRVKVTDYADNVFKCTSDNIVVYTDAEALTQFVDYYRLSVEDKEIKVNLNENTINEVTGNGITPEDYTIGEDGTITINGEFLETLPGRAVPATDEDGLYTSYIFNVSYNPLGIRFVVEPEEEFIVDEEDLIPEDVVYIEDNRQVVRLADEVKVKELAPEVYEKEFAFEEDIFARGDEPATTSFEVRVYKNANTGSFTVTDKVYDQTAATYTYSIANELVEGTPVSVLYANAGSDTWTAAAPTGAGSYTAKLVVSEDANYYGFELTDDYTIERRPASIGVFDETKTVGDSDPEWRYDFTGFLPGDSDLAWGWRDSGETAGTYTIHPNVQHVNPNYDITSINGTLTIEEAPAVVLAAPLGGGGGAAITTVANVEEEVAEIPEEEVPEAEAPEVEEVEEEVPAVVEIPEEEVPEAVAERCIIHWLVLADALLYAMYSIFRVLQNKEELSDDAESVEN